MRETVSSELCDRLGASAGLRTGAGLKAGASLVIPFKNRGHMRKQIVRPDWDHYFMEIARVVSKRSTCLRRSVGAVLVKNKQILATGYNGTPKGMEHCDKVGCLREKLHVPSGKNHELCRGIHAEQNAVIQGAVHGVSVEGATLYCTHQPCVVCTKILINAGVVRVVYQNPYPDKLAEDMLAASGMKVEVLAE